MLEARDVWKIFENGTFPVEAVRGASFSVFPGELVAVMGPSGSGKTTLLTLLGAMLTPSRGEIRIEGRSLAGLSPEALSEFRRRRIGFIFQGFNLFPALTALENVELGLRLRGFAPAEGRALAREALDSVGLGDRADFRPASLSGGQKQRVAVARALSGGPGLILADEPTGALDADNSRVVAELLLRCVREAKVAAVVVTHDPRLEAFVDRVLRMEHGRLVEEAAYAR